MDIISELPQHLLHQILCFLSQKEAVQTCVLAKSWRYLWSTRPKLELHEHNDFKKDDHRKEKFMHVLNKTLQGYHDQNLRIDELSVWTSTDEDSDTEEDEERAHPDLPSIIFQFEYLGKLIVRGWNINHSNCSSGVMLFKHLRKLCLHEVYIADETFEKIMTGCPLIEYVDMRDCEGMKIVKVNKARNLNYFAFSISWFSFDRVERSIEIDVPTIESISIFSQTRMWFHVHNYHFGHLKFLNLEWVLLTAKFFPNFSSNFPCVEDLGLKYCSGMDKLELSSVSIKRLVIENWKKFEASFDTPNIVEFVYKGYIPQSISFTTTSKLWKSDLSLMSDLEPGCDASTSWFLKLHQLLGVFSQSEIYLHIYTYNKTNQETEEADVIDHGLYKPVVVEQLELKDLKFHSQTSFSAFINALLSVCRPREIYRCWYTCAQDEECSCEEKNQVIEFLCKKLCMDERKDEECMISWQRDVVEVSFHETFDVHDKEEWHPVQSNWLEHCAALLQAPENLTDHPHYLCFLLKWS